MMKKRFSLVLALCLSAALPALADTVSSDAGWEELANEDGIQTWRKELEGSPVVAFKGRAVIDAPIAKVANVLYDTSRKLEWVAKIKESKDIRYMTKLERVEYNHTGTPWPLKDRDFVFHARARLDRANKTMVLHIQSVEDPAAPEQRCCIRAKLHSSNYTLKAVEGGAKTELTVEIHADPMGKVPKWVVNLFQKAWPRTTLENVQKQVAKADVKAHPELEAYFAGKDVSVELPVAQRGAVVTDMVSTSAAAAK